MQIVDLVVEIVASVKAEVIVKVGTNLQNPFQKKRNHYRNLLECRWD